MSAPFLTLDLGNSRCKLRRWSLSSGAAAQLLTSDELASTGALGAQLDAWLAGAGPLSGAAFSSVASLELEQALAAVLGERLGVKFRGVPEAGLEIACREPERVGRDRLFAARGAFELVRGSCLVLDAGTALTVDALRVEAGARPRFLGGAIAPGPRLLARALAAGTARLPEVDPAPFPRALGRDTREALEAGVALGFAGAARELVQRIAAEAGCPGAPLVLTGGARAFLEQPGLFAGHVLRVEPELVHLGLLAASGAAR